MVEKTIKDSETNRQINNKDKFSTINLSNYSLNIVELEGLEKGLTFVPTRHKLSLRNILETKNNLIRRIKLISYFDNKHKQNPNQKKREKLPFTYPSDWTPSDETLTKDTLDLCKNVNKIVAITLYNYAKQSTNNMRLTLKLSAIAISEKYEQIDKLDSWLLNINETENINQDELESLKILANDNTLIIKPADKGGATVIMDRDMYIAEAMRQLNNQTYYTQIPKPICYENKQEINKILIDMHKNKYISKKQLEFLGGPTDIRERIFYLLPKIHKPPQSWPFPNKMPEGRPIVSDINSETYNISTYINHYLYSLSINHPSYLKNSYELVNKLQQFNNSNHELDIQNTLLISADISALYTNMDLDRSIRCVEDAFTQNPEVGRPDGHIIKLLEICLKYNDFEFCGNYYKQVKGTAMGKRFAPALANIYLIEFDRKAMTGFQVKPVMYFRYIDDIFLVWPNTDTNQINSFWNNS